MPTIPKPGPAPQKQTPPTGIAGIDAAAAEGAAALEAKGDALAAGQTVRSQEFQTRAGQADTEYTAGMDEVKRQENAHKAARQELEAQEKALGEKKLDKTNWWSDQSTVGKIATVISVMASVNETNRTGQPNRGLAQIERLIEKDLQQQAADLQNERDSLQARRGILAESVRATGDLRQGTILARSHAYDSAAAMADAKAQEVSAPALKEGLKAEAAELRVKALGERERLITDKAQLAISRGNAAESVRHNKEMEKLQGQENTARQELAQVKAQTEAERKAGEKVVKDGSGRFLGTGSSKEVAEKLNERIAATEDIVRIVDEMTTLREKTGRRYFNSFDTDDEQSLVTKQGNLTDQLRLKAKSGSLDEGFVNHAIKLLGERPDGWYDNTPKWQEVKQEAIKSLNASLKSQSDFAGEMWTPEGDMPAGAGAPTDGPTAPPPPAPPGSMDMLSSLPGWMRRGP